jgi:hypothetical protein
MGDIKFVETPDCEAGEKEIVRVKGTAGAQMLANLSSNTRFISRCSDRMGLRSSSRYGAGARLPRPRE